MTAAYGCGEGIDCGNYEFNNSNTINSLSIKSFRYDFFI